MRTAAGVQGGETLGVRLLLRVVVAAVDAVDAVGASGNESWRGGEAEGDAGEKRSGRREAEGDSATSAGVWGVAAATTGLSGAAA
jgi:hypothetical protein